MQHLLWTEAHRPKTIEECILPERLKKPFQEYVNSEKIPHLLLSGGAGVGKTTVAKAMCNQIEADYIMINGSDESGIDVLRNKIKNYASSMSLSGGRKVVIIDEAMASGYAGVDNPLFFRENNRMLFGDAKKMLDEVLVALKT